MSDKHIALKFLKKYTKKLEPIKTGLNQNGSLAEPVKVILFDIYGTLLISSSGDIMSLGVDSNPDSNKYINDFKKLGVEESIYDLKTKFKRFVENEHKNMIALGSNYPEIDVRDIWKKTLKFISNDNITLFCLLFELITNSVYPMPKAKEVLDRLINSNIMVGIISNAQFYTEQVFEYFFGAPFKEFGINEKLTFLSYRFKIAKPSLFLFKEAAKSLENMNIKNREVLYVGNDMLNDIYPAKEIGFQTCLFAGDKRSLRLRETDSRCCNIKPTVRINELIQLFDYM